MQEEIAKTIISEGGILGALLVVSVLGNVAQYLIGNKLHREMRDVLRESFAVVKVLENVLSVLRSKGG